jgi:hypothetical protein
LAEAEADGNLEFASEQIAEIAAIDSAGEALNRLHQNYTQQRNPPQQAPQTPEELRVKPAEKMTWQDAVQVCNSGSKYPLSEKDYVEAFNKGVRDGSWAGRQQKG